MSASDNLGPQFLYHGTTRDIPEKVLPSEEHGQGSYWGEAGTARGEPAKSYAWAHPSEELAWDFAQDRLDHHFASGEGGVRTRVYAVHPNEQQSPGHDPSIPGEIKGTHFDVAHRIDTMPGRQGTFPEINWNDHAVDPRHGLPGTEDANHPAHLSEQFGHREGAFAYDKVENIVGRLQHAAEEEDTQRRLAHSADRNVTYNYETLKRTQETPLPFQVKNRFGKSV